MAVCVVAVFPFRCPRQADVMQMTSNNLRPDSYPAIVASHHRSIMSTLLIRTSMYSLPTTWPVNRSSGRSCSCYYYIIFILQICLLSLVSCRFRFRSSKTTCGTCRFVRYSEADSYHCSYPSVESLSRAALAKMVRRSP